MTLLRPLLGTFAAGCALGAATTLLLRRRSTEREEPSEPAREMGPLPDIELPKDSGF